ncbi:MULTISPECIES: DUF2147 domain-containing protein [Pedobacter]|uniref:DUF2147 domain-containing protein n=1 Tax=Pedobacter heparinus (strain ATCC 13125 / DSM 2366 / CIP 104194 / JCM 7457 / NBRC 12017 / NCIMB 9290 / NRRL B-14731 / HIM 762-3) TaxID=485917 RepID=C6Y2N6_PEDHD|nr:MULTISPECIES: DUF2147 domain-containing protein [Pedobacter]ACU05246.1 conserved hypothetical protein [Pedobacter heparinus DSM 2366]MBB5439213.1 uncharacterized protein (DUF2147 family) [Pedobacter sp. AK017]
MKHLIFLLLLTAISFTGFAQNKDAIIGKWINSSGEAHVDITKKGEKYFGKIVWLKEPKDEKGNVKTDVKNPDENQRKQPILGLEILKNFVFDEGKWTDGKIYDPKSGKTYSCNMTMKGNDILNMRGYIGFSLIGRSETWKRVK